MQQRWVPKAQGINEVELISEKSCKDQGISEVVLMHEKSRYSEVKQPAKVSKTPVNEVCIGNSFEALVVDNEDILVADIVCDRDGVDISRRVDSRRWWIIFSAGMSEGSIE